MRWTSPSEESRVGETHRMPRRPIRPHCAPTHPDRSPPIPRRSRFDHASHLAISRWWSKTTLARYLLTVKALTHVACTIGTARFSSETSISKDGTICSLHNRNFDDFRPKRFCHTNLGHVACIIGPPTCAVDHHRSRIGHILTRTRQFWFVRRSLLLHHRLQLAVLGSYRPLPRRSSRLIPPRSRRPAGAFRMT